MLIVWHSDAFDCTVDFATVSDVDNFFGDVYTFQQEIDCANMVTTHDDHFLVDVVIRTNSFVTEIFEISTLAVISTFAAVEISIFVTFVVVILNLLVVIAGKYVETCLCVLAICCHFDAHSSVVISHFYMVEATQTIVQVCSD